MDMLWCPESEAEFASLGEQPIALRRLIAKLIHATSTEEILVHLNGLRDAVAKERKDIAEWVSHITRLIDIANASSSCTSVSEMKISSKYIIN